MPITTETLNKSLQTSPEHRFTRDANTSISDHITRVATNLTNEHQRDPDRIKRIADHGNTALGTYEKQRNISAEANRLATAEFANAEPLIQRIMADLNRSGLVGEGRIDPNAFQPALRDELLKDLKTAIENTLQQQYKGVLRQENATNAQREQELHQYNRKLENIAASSKTWTRAAIVGTSIATLAGATILFSGKYGVAIALAAFPVGPAAAVAWFALPPVVGWIRKKLQPPFQADTPPPHQNPNIPPGPNTPPAPNTPPIAPTNPTTPPDSLDLSSGGLQVPPRPPELPETSAPRPKKEEEPSIEPAPAPEPRMPRPPHLTEPVTAPKPKAEAQQSTGPRVKSFGEEDLLAPPTAGPSKGTNEGNESVH